MYLVFSGAAINAQFSGFTITKEENLKYVRMLALEAHARGLAIGIKNSPDDLPDLIDHFDFAVVEDFFHENVAPNYSAMTARGKPVQLDWVVQKLLSPVDFDRFVYNNEVSFAQPVTRYSLLNIRML